MKQWLFGSEQIATSAALFPHEAYKGDIVNDLFGDVSYFADTAAFWSLQNVAVASLRDDLAAKGWKVTVLDKGARFPSWQYDEVPMEDGGEAFIEVRNNGEVEVHQGYRPYAETCSSAKAEDADGAPQAARPELTKAAENYLALHRHAIVRAELLAHPGIALRLALAHMIAGSPLWSVKPDPQRAGRQCVGARQGAEEDRP